MKKVLTAAATLSLLLIACADDSSSGMAPVISGGDSSSSIEESSSSENLSSATAPLSSTTIESSSSEEIESSSSAIFSVEKQVRNISAKCMYREEINTAEIVDGPGGIQPVSTISTVVKNGFVTVTLDVGDIPCGSTFENIKVTVESDTLVVVGDFVDSFLDCVCPTAFSFEVEYDPAFNTANYTKFNKGFVMPLHKIDPSIAQELEPSYSMVTKDFNAECKNHLDKAVDEPVDFNDNDLVAQIDTAWRADIGRKDATIAWYINEGETTTIVIDEVDKPCGAVFTGFDVVAKGDTFYAQSKIDPASPVTKCICPTRITLEIKQRPEVGMPHYLLLDGDQLFVLADAMSLVD